MEKQTLIRSAAIIVAGIAASTYGAQYIFSGKQVGTDMQVSMQSQSPQIIGAGLMGNLSPSTSTQVKVEDTSFAALSDGLQVTPVAETGADFAPRLAFSEEASNSEGAVDCTPRLVARPAVDALIELSLSAPCHANERLVVSHDDLAFSAFTSDDGGFAAFIPALSPEAKLDVFLSEDVFLEATVLVEDVDAHARVVLQWTGEADFALHAYHRGARFGEDGHIHALKPFDPAQDEAFLISLGDKRGPEPMLAEIYSVPAQLAAASRIELELQFSADECGADYSAFILKTGPNATAHVTEAGFATPNCPAESGTLVMELPAMAPQHAQLALDAGRLLSDMPD